MLDPIPGAKPVKKLKHHVFVCTNERPAGHPRGSCKEKGSEALIQAFKEEVARQGLQSEVRAQKSGCLDTCEYGTSVTVYPGGVWYGKVTVADIAEIVESHLKSGKPVERLRVPGK
jgi:(2Fe-2S) ferredoxin